MEPVDRCAEPAKTLPLSGALARIRESIAPLTDDERIPLKRALGRVLAEAVVAPFDQPPFANSAMDGYALRHQDLPDHANLAVIGTSFAGRPYAGIVGLGQSVRIFTGAAMPAGADTVVMQEDVVGESESIRLTRPISPGANVRAAGEEIRAGSRLLECGRKLNAADIGLLACAGFPEVRVTRKLKVAFFSTGDELRPLGEALAHGQIHDSNRYLLYALLDD
ncbi:MAG: molybdopterin molybdotransferase MoeA, partial [Methylococcaceae bacterium]|nr:molybdopterin molybdotransferase MoeA [Methylococcaceae bacterium]